MAHDETQGSESWVFVVRLMGDDAYLITYGREPSRTSLVDRAHLKLLIMQLLKGQADDGD